MAALKFVEVSFPANCADLYNCTFQKLVIALVFFFAFFSCVCVKNPWPFCKSWWHLRECFSGHHFAIKMRGWNVCRLTSLCSSPTDPFAWSMYAHCKKYRQET